MASIADPPVLQLGEGRFARLEAIAWWDQARLSRSRILVVGAGALGNEVIKNLALLGVGTMVVADRDRVELSNLSRSVLFRESDEGEPKAECAVRAAREIYPQMKARAIVGNVLTDVGLGWFRWADAIIAALDNREARVFVNSACARVGRPWFDGGIEVLQGIVRGFAPPGTACYECTMSEVDWKLLNRRRSCTLLARRALQQRGTPTTPTTASVIAAIQVQELVKHLHGRSALLGRGVVFDGEEHGSYRVDYPIHPDCPWHGTTPKVEPLADVTSDEPLGRLWREAERRLGGVEALDLPRELVGRVHCPACGYSHEVWQPAECIGDEQLLCPRCRTECAPVFLHSLGPESGQLSRTAREIGLPARDILWARHGLEVLGLEIAGDPLDGLGAPGEPLHGKDPCA